MFGSATLTLVIALFMLSLAARDTSLFLVSLVLLLAALLSRIWDRYCLTGLEYRRRFARSHASFGEVIEFEVEIVNRKLLPLAWLEVEDEIPRELPPARGRVYASHKPGRALLFNLVPLRPFERVRRRYPLPCNVRGEHVFGPARLRTGDLFGLVQRELVFEETDVLVVYPRVVPLISLGFPFRQPLGELRTRSWLFEDPSRIAGIRDYRPGDSWRRIHWSASARTQRLQTRIYEATTSQTLALYLNLRSVSGEWWGYFYDPPALELAITAAASITTWALAEGFQVGLFSNGMHRLVVEPVSVPFSAGTHRLPEFLDALGRLQPFAIRPFDRLLAEKTRHLPFGATIVVVSAVLSEAIAAELIAVRKRGFPVVLVLVSDEHVSVRLEGITIRQVSPSEPEQSLVTELLGGHQQGRSPVDTQGVVRSGENDLVALREIGRLRNAGEGRHGDLPLR